METKAIEVKKVNEEKVIIVPEGYLERELGVVLKNTVKTQLQSGTKQIVISLSKIFRVNSLGLSELLEISDIADENQAEVILSDIRKEIMPMLEVAGVTTVFQIL